MGPLANERRPEAVGALIEDAAAKGARVLAGGSKGDGGFFFQPTLLADVPNTANIMNEEPFGPVAIINGFDTFEDAVSEANRLPYGLGAYAFAASTAKVARLGDEVESGMISINHFGFAAPETPFGGIKDSGHGAEGGSEGLQAYLAMKFVSQVGA